MKLKHARQDIIKTIKQLMLMPATVNPMIIVQKGKPWSFEEGPQGDEDPTNPGHSTPFVCFRVARPSMMPDLAAKAKSIGLGDFLVLDLLDQPIPSKILHQFRKQFGHDFKTQSLVKTPNEGAELTIKILHMVFHVSLEDEVSINEIWNYKKPGDGGFDRFNIC